MVKNKIRKSLLEQGQLLSKKNISKINSVVQNSVINNINLSSSKNNLLYFPYRNEIKTNQIISELKKYSNNIYMPKILSDVEMKFNLFSNTDLLKENKYGIKEVINDKFLNSSHFDTMFVPLVGVDKNGSRLGYGSGYFDRAMSEMIKEKNKPLVVGMCFDYQVIDQEFGESHDMKYDVIFTETRILSFS